MHGETKAYSPVQKCDTDRRATLAESAQNIEGTLAHLDDALERIMDSIRPSPSAGMVEKSSPTGSGLEDSLLRSHKRADELLYKANAIAEMIDNRPTPNVRGKELRA
jgi:hypothetical protein